MRFYVLVSNSPRQFEETLRCLPRSKIQVVINTLKKKSEEALIKMCDHYEVPYVVTESDGTPATGKNSMMKFFLESDDDYGLFIDSGDIITPTGVNFYTKLAQHDKPPDLLVLYRQVMVYEMDIDLLKHGMLETEFPAQWGACYPCDKSRENIYAMTADQLSRYMEWQCPDLYSKEEFEYWGQERFIFQHHMNQYSEMYEYMTRMVFFSRKAAEHVEYETFTPDDRPIGEDTIQYFRLKKLALENKLRVYKKKDGQGEVPTYVQVNNSDGISAPHRLTWDWCVPISRKVEDMISKGEMPPPNVGVPEWGLTTY